MTDADGDAYVLNGGKRFISQGSVADVVIVFAVTNPDEEKQSRRLSAFVVETKSPGFRVERLEHKMGIRGSPTAELSFTDLRVPAANRLGAEGEGFAIAMRTFERSRPGIAAQAVGIAQGALDAAVAYAGERVQFGRPIGELQMVQALLADMDAATAPPARCCTRRARRSMPELLTLPAGRPSVNSWPETRRCGSRPTPCRCWADMAISRSSPWSA